MKTMEVFFMVIAIIGAGAMGCLYGA